MQNHLQAEPNLVKVQFQLEPGAWHGSATETMWAERLDERRFRVRNVPFFVVGVSVEDIVFANVTEGAFEFVAVSNHAGHSTYRIIAKMETPSDAFQSRWQCLERLGCTYEQGAGRLRAVDVPPDSNIAEVYEVFEEGERAGVWDFEEGHCGHIP